MPEIKDKKKTSENRRRSGPWAQAARRFCRNKAAVTSLIVLILVIILCLLAPILSTHDLAQIDLYASLGTPTKEHYLGTDALGRDIYSRLLYGGRITLRITFGSVALSLVGILIGLISGYVGGKTDTIISRVNDALSSIPTFLLVVFMENVMGWGNGNYMYAMAIAFMPPLVRLTRSLVMNIMGSEYIEAARALGVRDVKIVFNHVLRNIAAPIIVHVTNSAAEAMLMCTILGYLGIGVNPPTPEWGIMVRDGYGYLQSYPHMALIPCAAVVICVLALNIMGNGLRDAFDPETEEV